MAGTYMLERKLDLPLISILESFSVKTRSLNLTHIFITLASKRRGLALNVQNQGTSVSTTLDITD